MKTITLVGMVVGVIGCAGSPIGGKYGIGNNQAGYAAEARARQERRDRLALDRAEFERNCMAPVERTPAQIQWCLMRQHELERREDKVERQEDKEDQAERDFQSWRRERLKPKPKSSLDCTSSTSAISGDTTTHCE